MFIIESILTTSSAAKSMKPGKIRKSLKTEELFHSISFETFC